MLDNFKEWLVVHASGSLKFTTAAIMIFTAGIMLYDNRQENHIIPEYFKFGDLDFHVWVGLLVLMGFVQFYILLLVHCHKCRILGDLLLQLSGFIFILIGSAFIANYPPFNFLMVFYPAWGVGMIIAARVMGKRSRKHFYDVKRGTNK